MLITIILIYLLSTFSIQSKEEKPIEKTEVKDQTMGKNKVDKSIEDWRKQLSPAAFYVLRENGTEAPFTGEYYENDKKGTYYCAGCNNELFKSATKYHSGCGWPSFYDLSEEANVKLLKDTSHGMIRTEIRCNSCDGHLGHVFEDGPPPTGLRYCINSVALDFKED